MGGHRLQSHSGVAPHTNYFPVWKEHGFRKGKENINWGKHPTVSRRYRDDLPHPVRSGWEANVARILRHLGISYTYETATFDLGRYSYTPDFEINSKLFIEVKGWENGISMIKLRMMRKLYPEVEIWLVDELQYKQLKKQYKPLVRGLE
jgi:hypothetical protein